MGLTILALSVPIFLLGMKLFGKTYGAKSLIGTLALSFFTSLWCRIFGNEGILDYSKDMSIWLSCLYGGVLAGFGIGLVMRSGSNTGGTDILALILSKYTHIPAGTSLLIVDGTIIAASAFIFSIESAMYAVIVSYIVSLMINKIVLSVGTGYARTAYIISDKLDEIGTFIIRELDRSGTVISAKGLFSQEDKPMLMVVLPNYTVAKLVRFVHDTDPDAFMTILDTYQVLGEGFTPLGQVVEDQKNDVTQG